MILQKRKKIHMGRKKKSKIYFSKDTENAIVEYNAETDQRKKNEIFDARIYPALDKLAENIINTFKFDYVDNSYYDIKAEVVAFMVMNMTKYIQDKGKAFSYFGTMAKRYLIISNTANFKKYKAQEDLDAVDKEASIINDYTTNEKVEDDKLFINFLIEYFEKNMVFIFKKEKEKGIANAILEIFRRSDYLDLLNKKSVYIMIREMTDASTQDITKVANVMKEHYFEISEEFKSTGYVDTDVSIHFRQFI